MNNEIQFETPIEDADAILPEGWKEGDDIWNTDNWDGVASTEPDFFAPGDDSIDTFNVTNQIQAAGMQVPTTEPAAAAHDQRGTSPGEVATTATPTTEPAPRSEPNQESVPSDGMYRFRARYDHEDRDVEVDLEKEMPQLWQKAQNADRAQARLKEKTEQLERQAPLIGRLDSLARINGYESAEEMMTAAEKSVIEKGIEELVNAGVPRDWAEFQVNQRYGTPALQAATTPTTSPATQIPTVPSSPPARDYDKEVQEFLAGRPDLTLDQVRIDSFPVEVINATVAGKNLSVAYAEYERDQARAAAKQAKLDAQQSLRDNEVLRQNADAARRAPILGVTSGGGPNSQSTDYFALGMDADW